MAGYETFWDMYDLVLYTGYQSVMSLLQPMTPFLFLINDLLEVRTDPAKIACYQRALPQTKRDLGEWERCLWFQLYAAVLQVRLPRSPSNRQALAHPAQPSPRTPTCAHLVCAVHDVRCRVMSARVPSFTCKR
eukprot:2413389-Prymnesium_polylepis.1